MLNGTKLCLRSCVILHKTWFKVMCYMAQNLFKVLCYMAQNFYCHVLYGTELLKVVYYMAQNLISCDVLYGIKLDFLSLLYGKDLDFMSCITWHKTLLNVVFYGTKLC
jgi:hypothetical protein